MQVGDGSAIGVAAVGIHQPAVAIGDALALFAGDAEVAGGPRLDQHPGDVGDAAFGQGFDEAGIAPRDSARLHELVAHDPRLGAGHHIPPLQPAGCQIDHAVEGPVRGGLVAADEGLARDGIAGLEPAHGGLVGLGKRDRLEPGGGIEPAIAPHDGGGSGDFTGGQRIAGVQEWLGSGHTESRISGVVEQWMPPPFSCILS